MKIGVVFPQTEIGNDPLVIRDYAQTAEGLGYSHLLAYDHVLGANPQRPGGWSGPYTYQTPFHEVFVLLSYLAGVTQKLELVTGIVILPQRQTALVAKQTASLDVLSGGRLRLGVGLGWNEVEYAALNEDFHDRGKRMEEQVALLRRLWTEPLVDFKGTWHTIPDAGIMLGLKGFCAAIIGGMSSGLGTVIGGLLLGILESLGAGLISAGYKDAIAFIILLCILFLRPEGIFGKKETERV